MSDTRTVGSPWPIYTLLAVAAAVTVGGLGLAFYTSIRMTTVYTPLVGAAMEIKVAVSSGRLLLEGAIATDDPAGRREAFRRLDSADWYATAMLSGAVSAEGRFVPLGDAEMRRRIQRVHQGLAKFRARSAQRWIDRAASEGPLPPDPQYDVLYQNVMAQADQVETRLQAVIDREVWIYRWTQGGLIGACLALFVVAGFALRRHLRQRSRSERRITHLNAMLRAIRDISQLITRETDRRKLLAGACENFIQTRGCRAAWIALVEEDGAVLAASAVASGEVFEPVTEQLAHGQLPECARAAMAQSSVIVLAGRRPSCADCPMHDNCGGDGMLAVRLEARGRVFGVLKACVPWQFIADTQEQALFYDIAGDIAMALHRLDLEGARQRARRRMQQVLEELRRSNAELEQFAHVASHDLQEPLRTVTGYVQLLQQRYVGQFDAEADEFLGFTIDGVNHMQGLVSDLLAYSRVGSRKREYVPTDCQAVCAQVATALKSAIDAADAEVTYNGLPTIMADAAQMAQLLQNLIANAVKFRGDRCPRVHVSARREGVQWIFSVRDNGIGIDPKHADRVFMIFRRLHPRGRYEGTGVGLTICRKIVERHGGRIWFEPTDGGGATFRFTIPTREIAKDAA